MAQKETEAETQFLFPEFVNGVILMKSGKKMPLYMNYDRYNEELIFSSGPIQLTIASTDNELIDTIYADGRKFIRLDDKILELCYHSKNFVLFAQHKCNLEVIQQPGGYKIIGYGERSRIVYDGANPYKAKYSVDPFTVYWIRKENTLSEIGTMNELKRYFSHQKKILSQYIKENEVEFENVDDVLQLIKYLDLNTEIKSKR